MDHDEGTGWAANQPVGRADDYLAVVPGSRERGDRDRGKSFMCRNGYGLRQRFVINSDLRISADAKEHSQGGCAAAGVPHAQFTSLIDMIHAKGSSCMAGSSRYLDPKLKTLGQSSPELKDAYWKLLQAGIDIIETDLPIQVTNLIYENIEAPIKKARFFR